MTAPFVFLPGWCVGRGPLIATVDALNGTIIDLPGYGEAPLIDDFYAAADNIAARLQPGTNLCGWSLGVQLALAIAARHPDKVGKLVLIAGTLSFVQRDGWPHAMAPDMLAVGLRLGCINHALLTAEAIAARGLTLAGWVANCVDPQMARLADNVATLRERLNGPLLGQVPRIATGGPAAAAAFLDLPPGT